MIFYRLDPCDTLFFKSAEPMEAGENHFARTLFPPPSSVVQGALRTTWLLQHSISFRVYNKFAPEEAVAAVGRPGEPPPFEIVGPLPCRDNVLLLPFPAHWALAADKFPPEGETVTRLTGAEPTKSSREALGLKSNSQHAVWHVNAGDICAPESAWITPAGLSSHSLTRGTDLFADTDLWLPENRTGIALERTPAGRPLRRAREGHLYSARHIRLQPGVSLAVGITSDIGLEPGGILTLGGEQRVCGYAKTPIALPDHTGGDLWLGLSALAAGGVDKDKVFATRKPVYTGGWDFAGWFHKPLIGRYPAGAVYTEKLNETMISIN